MMLPVTVTQRRDEALDIVSLELAAADGRPLPGFSAGSHIDVLLPSGITRQYSLCNDPAETHRYLLCVQRDANSRGGSVEIADTLRAGDRLEISAPRNHFPLAGSAPFSLLLAGGIGVTPILCMAERLAQGGQPFAMHYCTRSAERTAFRDRIAATGFASRVHFHHDDGPPEQLLDRDAVLSGAPHGTHLYVCGPGGFMDWVIAGAKAMEWAEGRIHFEYFSAPAIDTADDGSFAVRLASSSRTVPVPADSTVAEALAAAGIEVPMSCESGVCGTCLTRVLEGVPDHRDVYLSDSEKAANDQFLPCCSRARTPLLVLDL